MLFLARMSLAFLRPYGNEHLLAAEIVVEKILEPHPREHKFQGLGDLLNISTYYRPNLT